jgi:hypothetical protein
VQADCAFECVQAAMEIERGVHGGLGRIIALHHLLIRSIPDFLTYSVPPFLKRHCDRTPGARPRGRVQHRRHGPGPLGAVTRPFLV